MGPNEVACGGELSDDSLQRVPGWLGLGVSAGLLCSAVPGWVGAKPGWGGAKRIVRARGPAVSTPLLLPLLLPSLLSLLLLLLPLPLLLLLLLLLPLPLLPPLLSLLPPPPPPPLPPARPLSTRSRLGTFSSSSARGWRARAMRTIS